jgi:hypothetical protein
MSWQFSGCPLFKPGAGLGPRFREDDDHQATRYVMSYAKAGDSEPHRLTVFNRLLENGRGRNVSSRCEFLPLKGGAIVR